jgi:hypothetical protein
MRDITATVIAVVMRLFAIQLDARPVAPWGTVVAFIARLDLAATTSSKLINSVPTGQWFEKTGTIIMATFS